jgi:hypothetical protein
MLLATISTWHRDESHLLCTLHHVDSETPWKESLATHRAMDGVPSHLQGKSHLDHLAYRGYRLGPRTFFQYLEFHTYYSHGNWFYMYRMSISTSLYMKNPYSDHLHLQTDIRAKLVTIAIFGFWVPTHTTHSITPWFQGIAQQARDHSEAHY